MEEISFNSITREFVEDFIAKMNKEEKQKLKEFIAANPRDTSTKLFTIVKSYIYRTYIKKEPIQPKQKPLFSDTLNSLLEDTDEEEN